MLLVKLVKTRLQNAEANKLAHLITTIYSMEPSEPVVINEFRSTEGARIGGEKVLSMMLNQLAAFALNLYFSPTCCLLHRVAAKHPAFREDTLAYQR
jgi:hypothetical protein